MRALDWAVVGLYFLFMLVVGLYFMRRASRSMADYFVSGRDLPWWVIALSAVATYTDAGLAPAVTMLTYQGGLIGNAVWWIPYVIWMPLGAVLWSKYWRRLGTVTSAELLNIRYSGKFAHLYRGIYSAFMSFGFIVVLMGYVSGWLGAALGPILGWEPISLILFSAIVTAAYTVASGLSGVAYTDAYQFGIFLIGNIILVPFVLAGAGGIEHVYQTVEATRGAAGAESFFRVIPPAEGLGGLTILAFVVQGLFFAASPTGGEGFTAQRFMAARNEFHAQVGQLFNAILTLILRVVPFLFLGLIAAALYAPGSIAEPGEIWARMVRTYAPVGLLGLLVAGIFAAYMSTISTLMNWGASYVVNDLYKPFLRPAESEHHYVWVGRVSSVVIFVLSLFVAYYFVEGLRAWFLFINSVVFAFILPLSWLRFFWWRLNIYGEAAALIIGLPLSYIVWFPLGFSNEQAHPFWQGFLLLFGLGSATIIAITYLTPPERIETLREFYRRCRPPGLWGPVVRNFASETRREIRRETLTDVMDCALGVAFCTAAIEAVISPLGRHWGVLVAALALCLSSGGLFIVRWSRRGVFRGLSSRAGKERLLFGALVSTALIVVTTMPVHANSIKTIQPQQERHALWSHPPDAGKSIESVREFVARCKRANIDTIVMDIKGMNGEIYWKSKRFPQAVAKGYEAFDLLDHLTREAHAQGIKVDAWLVDFAEGEGGAAYREHPEWAQLNPDGRTTASETLGVARRPYPYVWMCPARRPGYTDQWLLPMIEEIAAIYAVDSIHHDYVRYPGDVAPDGYCFCDYCLKHIPRYAMLSYETRSAERFRVKHIQERIEANWWSDPTMIPNDWQERDRREMADYILNGRTIPGGPPDMRYFFYDYRVHQIDTFVREVRERVRRINPKIEISAAVFKNPVQSARFIGQRWHEWSQWIDIYMPMTYRSHFAGSFETYLDHLAEITTRQLEWTRREKPLYAGIASTYLYREEMQPLEELREGVSALRNVSATDAKKRTEKANAVAASYSALRERLGRFSPERERELAALMASVIGDGGRGATPEAIDKLATSLNQLRRDLPPGFCPPEKLQRAIEAARRAKPDGIVIFSAGNLTIEKLWPALEIAFKR